MKELREIDLRTDDFWIKVVDMLQHNWAVIRPTRGGQIEIIFFHDGSIVFDKISGSSYRQAEADLRRNGFLPYDDPELHFRDFIAKPRAPFLMGSAAKRPIYSSGEYWN